MDKIHKRKPLMKRNRREVDSVISGQFLLLVGSCLRGCCCCFPVTVSVCEEAVGSSLALDVVGSHCCGCCCCTRIIIGDGE